MHRWRTSSTCSIGGTESKSGIKKKKNKSYVDVVENFILKNFDFLLEIKSIFIIEKTIFFF